MCNSNKKKNCNENAKTIYLDTKLCGKEPPTTTANVVHSSEMEGLCLKWNDCGQML